MVFCQLPVPLTLSTDLIMNIFTNKVIRHGHSDCAEYIITNLKDASVLVKYNNGSAYRYTNVSRRAILNLMVNDNISLGRWINDVLLYINSKCAEFGTSELVYKTV